MEASACLQPERVACSGASQSLSRHRPPPHCARPAAIPTMARPKSAADGAAHPGAAARLEAPMRPAEPKAKPRAAKRGAGAPSAQQGRRSLEDRSNSPNNAEPLWGFWKDVSVAQAKRLAEARTADAAVAKPSPRRRLCHRRRGRHAGSNDPVAGARPPETHVEGALPRRRGAPAAGAGTGAAAADGSAASVRLLRLGAPTVEMRRRAAAL